MCGICGIINYNNKPVSENNIRLMMHKMKHRGPDDEGVFIDYNIGLGFVRLSILDLTSAGHQPMFSHDGRYVIVFNGEVYNYIEIRNELKTKYQFRTGTDTEVVLAAYQEWGEECLNKFNGMFAFVIYDTKTKEIFGARDRFGIKPFYFYYDNDKFIFASEIKSILPFLRNRKPNDKIIADYLLYNKTDHTKDTFFNGIHKLHHGSFLIIKNNKVEKKAWYCLRENVTQNKTMSPFEYKELFDDALKLRLRSDVPVGVCLSGGIDSSAIVASLMINFGLSDLNTFSAVYGKNEPTDESIFIDEFKPIVKNMYFTNPSADSFYNDLSDFIDAHNEPVPDTGPYAQYKVMELAKNYITVTLDGQGADEQLGGYHYFFGSYYVELIRKIKILKLISENFHYLKDHKSLTALKYFIFYLMPKKVQQFIGNKIYQSVNSDFISKSSKVNDSLSINDMIYDPHSLQDSLIQHFEYKLEHLLRWEDLNAMHFSIESRVPFLDHRLVEKTLSLPSDQILRKGVTKYILRESMKNILPTAIFERKDKKGFTNPRDKWFRTEQFQKIIFNIINSNLFKNRGYFDYIKANERYKMHLDLKVDISKEIWKWINLELWFREFID